MIVLGEMLEADISPSFLFGDIKHGLYGHYDSENGYMIRYIDSAKKKLMRLKIIKHFQKL